MATAVVTCFLRNAGEVLLLKRSAEVGSYPGLWGGVAGHAEGDPDAAMRAEIREETGLDPDRLARVRTGEPFTVADGDREWRVHPSLFDCPTREVRTNWETETHEWVPPTAILRRETVPALWTSYDRVRPRVETVAGDLEHGSAYLSVRALEVLRDEAALAGADGGWEQATAVARDLCEARPAMAVVATRIDRAVHRATSGDVTGQDPATPAALEAAATAGIERATAARERVAASAADRVGDRVATLSRSGTVRATLERVDPAAVLVAESRPGREGVGVAEDLADGTDVTLTTDAALPHRIGAWGADTLLVGADAVLPDGRVLNKAGTHGAALAAARAGADVVVAASVDKVRRDGAVDLAERDPAEVYDGAADIAVSNPTFDLTPAGVVTVVGEDGPVDVAGAVATHRERAAWR